jgi:hypothetical protein
MVDTFTFTIPMIILNLDKPELNIDPPKAERFVVSPSHRGVGFMPYGPEAEAQALSPLRTHFQPVGLMGLQAGGEASLGLFYLKSIAFLYEPEARAG